MRKLLLTASLVTSLFSGLRAQQDVQFTHYMFDWLSINPATAGIKGGYCGTLFYRNQWDKVVKAPNSVLMNVQGMVPKSNFGVGMTFIHDAIGFFKTNTINVSGAYHMPFIGTGTLSGGLSLGVNLMSQNPDWITPDNVVDGDLNYNAISNAAFDAGAGLFWQGWTNKYYVGVSVNNIAGGNMKDIFFSYRQHLYVIGGYPFNLGGEVELEPSVLFKSDFVSFQTDINLRATWRNMIWGGLSYRITDAVAIMAGYQWNADNTQGPHSFKVGYSYDIRAAGYNTYNKGTHEFFLGYCFNQPPKPEPVIYHPETLGVPSL